VLPDRGTLRVPGTEPRPTVHGLLLVGGLLLVFLIALLDYNTGPHLDHSILYLIPVAACAWWGGFSHGILLALTCSLAWHVVDVMGYPDASAAVGVWNGVVRFGTFALVSSLVSRLHIGVLRERWLARTDPLTGAANARTFYETAIIEAERATRTSRPLTLAYIDLDNFKQLNDQRGHAAGDETLIDVVRLIHENLRGLDLLARLGGDEFALLLPETGAEGAVALLARLQQILTAEMVHKGSPVTFSVGAITFLRPVWDVDVMIRRVDALMYMAKKKGKGRVEHAIVEDGQLMPPDERKGAERRALTRLLCSRSARVHREGEEAAFATLRDISAEGVGLYLESRLPLDSILVVEPISPEARTLLARVVHVSAHEDRWVHGCVLSTRLSAEEISGWLGAESTPAPITPSASMTGS
jgi:diguanylate cyclase (GGDEF)-like protein